MPTRRKAEEQKDVLPAKGDVTQSDRGLQQWGEGPMGDAIGTAGSGTAERAAKIAAGQRKSMEGDERDEG